MISHLTSTGLAHLTLYESLTHPVLCEPNLALNSSSWLFYHSAAVPHTGLQQTRRDGGEGGGAVELLKMK